MKFGFVPASRTFLHRFPNLSGVVFPDALILVQFSKTHSQSTGLRFLSFQKKYLF
jgi:hypothetical protein